MFDFVCMLLLGFLSCYASSFLHSLCSKSEWTESTLSKVEGEDIAISGYGPTKTRVKEGGGGGDLYVY